jgi:aminoglycoside 6'-N-acetyltransferase I
MSAGADFSTRIREAGVADREAWLALRAALWPEWGMDVHARIVRQRLDRAAGVSLLAESGDGEVIGFIELDGPALTVPRTGQEEHAGEAGARLHALFVVARHRRKGVGTLLLAEAEARLAGAATGAAAEVVLELSARHAHLLPGLQGLGFEETGTVIRMRRQGAAVPPRADAAPARAPVASGLDAQHSAVLASAAARGEQPVLVIHEPRSRRLVLFHLAMAVAAVLCVANTRIFSSDPVVGGLLPLLDVLFVLYFAALFVIWRYRRRTESSARADRLFGPSPGDGHP